LVAVNATEKVVCYYNHTSFRRQTPMSFRTGHVPVSFCTHAVYASVGISDDLELIAKEPEFDIVQGGLIKFAALKKTHPHLTVLAAIGEDMKDSRAFKMISKNAEDRKTFAKNVQFWLNRFSYDGIVVHWKQYHQSQAAHYQDELNRIVATLRQTLGSTRRIYIGVPDDQEIAHFDLVTLFQSVDQFFVLPYWMLQEDGRTVMNKTKMTAFPHPLDDVLRTKHSLVSAGKEALFHKFCFVFSIAGRSYTLADGNHYEINSNALGPGKPGPFTGTPGLLAFYEICNRTWTTRGKGTYGSYAVEDDQWIGYLDAPSLERVLRMVLWKHKAACVGIWDVSLDDFRGVCGDPFPLTKVIAGWHDRSVV
ncbi:endochitinase-like, partial [Ixodes scapularis]|uniref:endochitinase-like n=1 Tax=Ixodes scapularis TaxID=6945 RepID=UPI001C39598D